MQKKLYALVQKGKEKRVAISDLGGKGIFSFVLYNFAPNDYYARKQTPFGEIYNISDDSLPKHYTSQAKMNADGWKVIATEVY